MKLHLWQSVIHRCSATRATLFTVSTTTVSRCLEGSLSPLFRHLLFTLVSLSFPSGGYFLYEFSEKNISLYSIFLSVPGELIAIDYLYRQTFNIMNRLINRLLIDKNRTMAYFEYQSYSKIYVLKSTFVCDNDIDNN